MYAQSLKEWTFSPVALRDDSVGQPLLVNNGIILGLTDTSLAFMKGLLT